MSDTYGSYKKKSSVAKVSRKTIKIRKTPDLKLALSKAPKSIKIAKPPKFKTSTNKRLGNATKVTKIKLKKPKKIAIRTGNYLPKLTT